MNKEIDQITRFLNRALDILLAKYPARTGLGVVLGLFISFILDLFKPALQKLEWIDYSAAPWWGGLTLGILAMHAPTIISLFRAKSIGNEEVDKVLALIEAGNFSEEERRTRFREIVVTFANQLSINQSTSNTIKELDIISKQKKDRKSVV